MSIIQKIFNNNNTPISRRMTPINWSQAKCHGYSNIYFDQSKLDRERARSLCKKCPIRIECSIYGLSQAYGMWGGISESQRRKVPIIKISTMCSTCLYNRLTIKYDNVYIQICPQCGILYKID